MLQQVWALLPLHMPGSHLREIILLPILTIPNCLFLLWAPTIRNDKSCVQRNTFTPDQLAEGEELEFIIRFQNTGTFQADNVRIRDTLSNYFDLGSFRVVSASHPMRFEMTGNGITDFIFENIFLPDSFSNEPNSHGFVKYAIKALPELQLEDAIANTASIYFDY